MEERDGTQKAPATEIEIFGAVYRVRGREDDEYLRELARQVDETMREVAGQVSTVDTAKIAILAAINLADRLEQCRMEQDGVQVEIKERVVASTAKLTEALRSKNLRGRATR